MSAIYFLGKFSNEALMIELFLIGLITTAYFGYLIAKKRKYGVVKNMVPDHVVKAFLIDLLSYSEGFKKQLFGENMQIDPSLIGKFQLQVSATPTASAVSSAGGTDATELHALKMQLGISAQKIDELNKIIASLQSQNGTLQTQATDTSKAGAVVSGDSKELLDKIQALEIKLSEYSVIEDDLANLKRYMQENKMLKEKLAGTGGAPIDIPTQSAPTPSPTPAAADPTPAPSTPEPAVAVAPAQTPAAASAPTGASVKDTSSPTPTPSTPSPAVAAADPAVGGDKSDADLLNEFERMLNS